MHGWNGRSHTSRSHQPPGISRSGSACRNPTSRSAWPGRWTGATSAPRTSAGCWSGRSDFTRVSPADQQWHLGQVLHDDGNYEGRRNQRVLDQIEKVSQLPRWPAMSHRERAAALERQVQWDGFDAGDRFDVIENVLDGKDRSGWLDGIKTLAEKAAREDAIWEEAARRGTARRTANPTSAASGSASRRKSSTTLKRTDDFVRIDNGQVVSERLDSAGRRFHEAGRLETARGAGQAGGGHVEQCDGDAGRRTTRGHCSDARSISPRSPGTSSAGGWARSTTMRRQSSTAARTPPPTRPTAPSSSRNATRTGAPNGDSPRNTRRDPGPP